MDIKIDRQVRNAQSAASPGGVAITAAELATLKTSIAGAVNTADLRAAVNALGHHAAGREGELRQNLESRLRDLEGRRADNMIDSARDFFTWIGSGDDVGIA